MKFLRIHFIFLTLKADGVALPSGPRVIFWKGTASRAIEPFISIQITRRRTTSSDL